MIEFLVDREVLPDAVLRLGIRRNVRERLREEASRQADLTAARAALISWLRTQPIAPSSDAANAQHYDLPAAYFAYVLGPHLKYSCGWWPPGVETLADAESGMLQLSVERATIADGHRILDLGCGWGALTLYMAERFPASRIVAVSNSRSQGTYVMEKARERSLDNVETITADVNHFNTQEQFDRIVSVEMLEHVRNHALLFARLRRWLAPDGRLFVHVFAHERLAYPYEVRDPGDWMARHFFTGGLMPSHDLLVRAQNALTVEDQWRLDGQHYQKTAEAWLRNFDDHRAAIDEVLAGVYGRDWTRWGARWRVFFLACAELFGYHGGREWGVSHYRFRTGE
jgi:cyclopropane-fatty-acyl-phospholipid synthase